MIRDSRTLFAFYLTVMLLFRHQINVFNLQNSHERHYSIDNPFCQLEHFHSNHVLEIRIYREFLDPVIVYTYRTAIEQARISTSHRKCSKRSHFDGRVVDGLQSTNFRQVQSLSQFHFISSPIVSCALWLYVVLTFRAFI